MYPVMVAIGFFAYLIYFKTVPVKREKIDRASENRLLFVTILGFLALFVSAFVMNSFFHAIKAIRAGEQIEIGGITWLGGVLGLIPAVYLLIHFLVPKRRGDEIRCFSTMMPGLVLAHGFGRLGCFFGGCCYGAPTNSFLGVVFPAGSAAGNAYPDFNAAQELWKTVEEEETLADGTIEIVKKILYPSVPVLPTQLFEVLFAFILFAVMVALYKKLRYHYVELYAFAYGTFRFVLEFWRGDDRGADILGLSPSQLMSIILMTYAVLLILFKNKKAFKKLYSKCEMWRAEADKLPAVSLISSVASAARRSTVSAEDGANKIRELHSLMEDGIISVEEFEKKKTEILARM